PRLAVAVPAPGDLLAFTNVSISFSERVTGVEAADLLVNGVPASTVTNESTSTYTFSFPQPSYGPVVLSWAVDHGIQDFDDPPKPFDSTATNSVLHYTLFNPAIPRIAGQTPAAGATITNLPSLIVRFTESVVGVNASDLLVNGL